MCVDIDTSYTVQILFLLKGNADGYSKRFAISQAD